MATRLRLVARTGPSGCGAPTATTSSKTLNADQPVHSVAFDPRSDRLASAGDNCSVKVWDQLSGKSTPLPCEGHGPLFAVAFNPQVDSVAAGGVDGKLRLWRGTRSLLWGKDIMDPLRGQIRARFNLASGRPGVITSVAFSPTDVTSRRGAPYGDPMKPPAESSNAGKPQAGGPRVSRCIRRRAAPWPWRSAHQLTERCEPDRLR